MESFESMLIALYAAHDVEEIRGKPVLIESAFGRNVEELSRDRLFPLLKELVETQKRYIEGKCAQVALLAAQAQIGACLQMLLPKALFPGSDLAQFETRMGILRQLMVKMFGSRWSQAQRDHFNYMVENLIAWKSYFLSYTNRGARASNERYKKVIKRAPAELWRGRNWDEENLLAPVIVNSLFVRNVQRCFFDKKAIGTGQNLMLKIGPALDNVFALVQLVQTESFTEAEDNYSYMEWKLFHDLSAQKLVGREFFKDIFEDRFAAVLAHKKELVYPDLVPEGYDKWRDFVFKANHHTILPTEPEEFDATMQRLKERIVSVQGDILAAVPT